MAHLKTKIELYAQKKGLPAVDFQTDVTLRDDSDGKGSYIETWNLSIAKPTISELSAYETAGNTKEANNVVLHTRQLAYGDIGEQLDEIYHDIDAWRTRIKAIKDKYPKE